MDGDSRDILWLRSLEDWQPDMHLGLHKCAPRWLFLLTCAFYGSGVSASPPIATVTSDSAHTVAYYLLASFLLPS